MNLPDTYCYENYNYYTESRRQSKAIIVSIMIAEPKKSNDTNRLSSTTIYEVQRRIKFPHESLRTERLGSLHYM